MKTQNIHTRINAKANYVNYSKLIGLEPKNIMKATISKTDEEPLHADKLRFYTFKNWEHNKTTFLYN